MIIDAPNQRDDFSAATKKVIAQRSGYRCAICKCQTDGPTLDPNKAVSIGEAAHITAASHAGPRYNPNLSTEERCSPENGLWACKNHHWIIDHDKLKYTVDELVRIKEQAEERARLLQGIEDAHGPEVAAAVTVVRGASDRMIEQWRTKYQYAQTEMIELDFREASTGGASGTIWSLAQVRDAVAQGHKLTLAGRPGAGKTITLIQLAGYLSANIEGPIPLLFSVSGWVASNSDLASYVIAQLTNAGVPADAIRLLFSTGRLAILLNGWNEAPDTEQARASEQLNDFLLNQAVTGLVLSTRATRHSPTLVGETVLEVMPLTDSKKESIVRAANLSKPDELLQQITHNQILDEVTQTPLFLAAAIKLARAGRHIPNTRSGLLESFLSYLQETDNHAVRLRTGPCQDCHYRYQTALAVEMIRNGQTSLPIERTQAIIGNCSTALIAEGRIGQASAASAIAESLTQHHALVYLQADGADYGFIHQQFQEWFASRWLLDELHRLAEHPETPKIFALQRDVLNRPAWAEAIGFALESLIAERAIAIAAAQVRWMMPIDLIRAAELCHMGGSELWAAVGPEMGRALRRWYELSGAHRYCALTAMLATGQPDFADLIWPDLEANDQSMFRLCRLYKRFHVGVLGPDWANRMSRWPEKRESLFIRGITADATSEEITYADVRAQQGPPAVRVAALKLLAEHGQFVRVLEILFAPEFGNWNQDIYGDVIPDIPAALLTPHAETVRRRFDATESLLLRAGIVEFLRRIEHSQWVDLARAELTRALAALRAAPLFPMRTHDAPAPAEMRVISLYTQMLWRTHSAWMADWLVVNFGENLPNQQPLSRWIESFPEDALVALASRIVAAGARGCSPSTVELLICTGSARVATIFIDAYLSAKVAGQEPIQLPRTSESLRQAPVVLQLLVDAILSRAENVTDFQQLKALIDVLSPVTALDGSLGKQIEMRQRDPMRTLIMRVSATIPTDDEARSYRPTLAVLLGSLGAPEDVTVVSGWVTEENERWEEYRRQVAEAGAARPPRRVRHYGTSWWTSYAGALALFSCPAAELEFFRWLEHPWLPAEGAAGLVNLSLMDGSLPRLPDNMSFRRATQRPTRPLNDIGPAVRPRADAIAQAIERIEALPADNLARKLLPEMAAALGRLNDPRAIDRLLALRTSWNVLGAFMSMQARGVILPGRLLASSFEPFIVEHEGDNHNQNDQWHTVIQVLRLQLFSDEPRTAIDRIRRLPASRMNSYHARDIFALLAESPLPDAASLLLEYSNSIPLHGGAYGELIEALTSSSDSRCHERLLELLHAPAQEMPGGTQSQLNRCIFHIAERDNAFRLRLIDAIRNGTVQWVQPPKFGPSIGTAELFETVLREVDLRPVEQELRQLIEELSETHEPAGSPSSYYVFPADATAIKQRLARLLAGGGHNAEVASRLLASLRLKRAQYGQPGKEPLHPDINLLETGTVSWPISLS